MTADPTVGGGGERGLDSTLCCGNYWKRIRVLTRQPLKEQESREVDRGLLKGFLLLQTMYPAVCDIGVEKSVADHSDALSEAQNKACMGR